VILHAVTSDNLDFTFVVGKDAPVTLDARRSMSDRISSLDEETV
jgi:hypothetical protein